MVSRFQTFVRPVAIAASLAFLAGCAGSKSSSSDMGGGEVAKNQKLEDARRSAEDAESKAHQLREEKNRTNTAKTGN